MVNVERINIAHIFLQQNIVQIEKPETKQLHFLSQREIVALYCLLLTKKQQLDVCKLWHPPSWDLHLTRYSPCDHNS